MVKTDEDGVEEGAYQDEPTASAKWVEHMGVIELKSELMKRLGFSCTFIVSLTTKIHLKKTN